VHQFDLYYSEYEQRYLPKKEKEKDE